MDAADVYDALEKLTREVVPPGHAQAQLLSEISKSRAERPDTPPAKGLLHELEQISDVALYKEEHSRLIKDIVFFWV